MTTTAKTGNNETTTWDPEARTVTVRLHDTDIVTVNVSARTVTLDNGGWNTATTSQHINRALARLHVEHPWIPNVTVGHERRKLNTWGDLPKCMTIVPREGIVGRHSRDRTTGRLKPGPDQPNSMRGKEYYGSTY